MIMDRKEILIRIIDNAIVLWFDDKDPVSIHILACVAHQNLDVLGKAKGVGPTLKEKVKWEQLYAAYDGIRHASGKSGELTQFAPVNTQIMLTDCIVSFEKIFGFRTPWMNTFGSYCVLPELRTEDPDGEFFIGVRIKEVARLSRQAFAAKMIALFIKAHKRGFY